MCDECLYDDDFNSPENLASTIYSIRSQFKAAGLDIPISISDMAYGWQQAGQTSSSSPVAEAVDFFMANVFPYFSNTASWGGDQGAFDSFKSDISFFEGIANGRPILVTQTGWPSNEDEFSPNSGSVVASVGSEQAYWNLLDGHCGDFFKVKNIGWMWRDYNDEIEGWGVTDANGNFKFNVDGVQTSC
jgi:exo-beta-1,3-glucanase (GH17 family)